MKYIKLYESFLEVKKEAEEVYQKSLKDNYWKDIDDKFPNYNDPDSEDCNKAVDYIFNKMKEKYPEYNWKSISQKVKDSIHGGIT